MELHIQVLAHVLVLFDSLKLNVLPSLKDGEAIKVH